MTYVPLQYSHASVHKTLYRFEGVKFSKENLMNESRDYGQNEIVD